MSKIQAGRGSGIDHGEPHHLHVKPGHRVAHEIPHVLDVPPPALPWSVAVHGAVVLQDWTVPRVADGMILRPGQVAARPVLVDDLDRMAQVLDVWIDKATAEQNSGMCNARALSVENATNPPMVHGSVIVALEVSAVFRGCTLSGQSAGNSRMREMNSTVSATVRHDAVLAVDFHSSS
jgi:hypothetical protein